MSVVDGDSMRGRVGLVCLFSALALGCVDLQAPWSLAFEDAAAAVDAAAATGGAAGPEGGALGGGGVSGSGGSSASSAGGDVGGNSGVDAPIGGAGTGGDPGTGGSVGSGGVSATGGILGTGGRVATGGSSASGGVSGLLTVSSAIPTTCPINLTIAGTADWISWGRSGSASADRKATATHAISDLTVLGSGSTSINTRLACATSWTDGATSSVAINTRNVNEYAMSGGFRVTAPADTTRRKLTVIVGIFLARAQMVARLSDGSAPDYTDVWDLFVSGAGEDIKQYVFTYQSAEAGQTLTVEWTMRESYDLDADVSISAAALAQ